MSTYYSSENRRLRPHCIVQPRTTEHVATAVGALRKTPASGNWDIAVRSGGHSDFDNNAVNRGVTIDLSFFNDIKFEKKPCVAQWTGESRLTKAVVQIQPGARWGDTMTFLEPYNLGATGGRSGHVGVGGLLVSGGASYHTQLWGLSCDNVVGYEVVLADGRVVEANAKENKDIFRALKGGGSNVGIVTRFDMRTFTVPPAGVYGGLLFASWQDIDVVNDQFVSYATDIGEEGSPNHEFVVYQSDGDGTLGVMVMAVATDGNETSTTFAPFDTITLTADLRAKQPLSQIAATIADTGGNHYIPFSLVLQATPEIMAKAKDIFTTLSEEMVAQGVPVGLVFVFQPLAKSPPGTLDPKDNILGWDQNLAADSILFEARGTLLPGNALHGGVVTVAMAKAIEELRVFSASQEGHSTYLYMNYANPEQDVIGSYGKQNVDHLKRVSKKYDPEGFFQYRVPGGWKVNRVE